MGLQIEGNGSDGGQINTVGVDEEKRMLTRATIDEFDAHINRESGKVWSLSFEGLNPAGADDYVFYLKNDGDKVLQVTDVRVMADTAATQVEIHAVSGTASGGTDLTPVSRTIGSAATPSATIETGTDITGLTNDGILFFLQCDTVNREYHLRTSSRIRIPKGKAMAILVETATANVTGVVSLVEEE